MDGERVARDRWADGRAGSGGGAQSHVAVPRQGQPARLGYNDHNWNRNGYRVYSPHYRTNNYYSSHGYGRPYYYYPYAFGYGPYGRGFFYFDLSYNSYVFYPHTVVRYDNYGTYYGNYGYPRVI